MVQYQKLMKYTEIKMNKYINIFKSIIYLAWCRNKARFVKTKLGSFWIGLTNLLQIGCLAFVYTVVFNIQDKREYIAYISFGILFWNSLSMLISDFTTVLNRSRDRLLSTSLNIFDVILEEYIFAIQNLLISILMVFPVVFIINPEIMINFFSLKFILGITLYLLNALVLAICMSGVGLLSPDLHQLIPIVLQLSFLTSPILYFKKTLVGKEWIYQLNPFYKPVGAIRDTLIFSNDIKIKELFSDIFIYSLMILSIFYFLRKFSRKINLYVDRN